MKGIFAIAAVMFVAFSAFARTPDGTLGNVVAPNAGRSAIVTPGDVFTVTAREPGGITLVGDATYAIDAEWYEADGFQRADCVVPVNVQPGNYALGVETTSGYDSTQSAVHVMKTAPDTYIAIHLTDLHLGSVSNGRPVSEIAQELAAAIALSPADIVLLTGEITATGSQEEYSAAIEFLVSLEKPAIVCPGDGDGGAFERFFGPLPFTVSVGDDNFLALDSRSRPVGDANGFQSGAAIRLRDAIKPGRWSVGLTHYFGPRWDPRMSIALFVDDPLDHLFSGYYHRENRAGERRVPWGTTPLTMTPAASDGAVRFVEIGPRGIRPEAPRYLVKTE